MDHFEMVEKLRAKANVSYEEAKAALEATDWDLLDALVFLEGEGRLEHKDGEFTTQEQPREHKTDRQKGEAGDNIKRLLHGLRDAIEKGSKIFFVVERKGKHVISLPLSVCVLLAVFLFWWVAIVLVAGLFLGFRYSVKGEGALDKVNQVMDKASETAEKMKDGIVIDIERKDSDR